MRWCLCLICGFCALLKLSVRGVLSVWSEGQTCPCLAFTSHHDLLLRAADLRKYVTNKGFLLRKQQQRLPPGSFLRNILWCFGLFLKLLEGICCFCEVTDTSILNLRLFLSWCSKTGWILSLACFVAFMQWIPQIHLRVPHLPITTDAAIRSL